MSKHAQWPVIAPVAEKTDRPRWSVMIPTYNCADTLKETLRGVLAQDPGPRHMQIEVIDDQSTKDDPGAVVGELGGGRVSFYRQPENVGPQANFTTCIQRAKGHLVHILHGDDVVLPGFYSRLEAAFDAEPAIGAAFTRLITIDENGVRGRVSPLERATPGIIADWLERIAATNRAMFASMVVRRRVYEELGGFHPELFHTSDWDMWKRIAVRYPVWFEPEPLALYREHSASDTSRLVMTGANIADARRSIEISQDYLPPAVAAELSAKAREHHAFAAFYRAAVMLTKGEPGAAVAQVREGFRCGHFFGTTILMARTFIGAGQRRVARAARGEQPLSQGKT